jgi:hypothetical protein
MKKIGFLCLFNIACVACLYCQSNAPDENQQKAISLLIDQYATARETRDTTLLKTILMEDVDQLVSTGEWRYGLNSAVQGMLKSSANSPGTRMLQVDKVKMISSASAVVDCKYEIQNASGEARKMWSTFIVVAENGVWKISAIRNMLPAK